MFANIFLVVLVFCFFSHFKADDGSDSTDSTDTSFAVDCDGSDIHMIAKAYDIDGSGGIDSDELMKMSMDMGIPMLDEEASGVISKYAGSSGEMSDADLCNYLNTLVSSSDTTSASIQAFITQLEMQPPLSLSKPLTLTATYNPTEEWTYNPTPRSDTHNPTSRTYNPTPSKYNPTSVPVEELRTSKKSRSSHKRSSSRKDTVTTDSTDSTDSIDSTVSTDSSVSTESTTTSSYSLDCDGDDIHMIAKTYDADGSGGISSDELVLMMMDFGTPILDEEASGIVSKYSGVSTGELTDADLCNYMKTLDASAVETFVKTLQVSSSASSIASAAKPLFGLASMSIASSSLSSSSISSSVTMTKNLRG